METAFGQEEFISSYFEDNFAGTAHSTDNVHLPLIDSCFFKYSDAPLQQGALNQHYLMQKIALALVFVFFYRALRPILLYQMWVERCASAVQPSFTIVHSSPTPPQAVALLSPPSDLQTSATSCLTVTLSFV